uniref:Uncharacterized protein n=1 Tax=Lactuca sativa TaxID=4236 RepID=A0A9R1VFI4_LACSA|nr:hypothetical protein LSAT_V11C500268590 [Lactuca sativa]
MIHGIVKFSTRQGLATIIATNTRVHHYHQIIAAPELARASKKSKEDCSTKQHQVNAEYTEQLVRIGDHLSGESKAWLVALLKQYSVVTTQVVPLHFPVSVNEIFQFIKFPLIRGRQLSKHFNCLCLIYR